MFENPKGKVSIKEEQFAYLLVDVAEEGRDLYDGLDKVFDESEVELENGKACRRVGLVELPPILQIQLQVKELYYQNKKKKERLNRLNVFFTLLILAEGSI